MNLIISANSKIYDCVSAFKKWGFVDWHQTVKYAIGDIVYIYCTKPIMKVMYKTIVEKESLQFADIVDDSEFWQSKDKYKNSSQGKYVRLLLVKQVNSEKLSLPYLIENGLKSAP